MEQREEAPGAVKPIVAEFEQRDQAAWLLAHVQCRSDRLRDARGVEQRGQLDQPHPRRIFRHQLHRCLDRQPRLAATA